MKTYAWIIATAISNEHRIKIIILLINIFIFLIRKKFLRSLINKCPATMLAVNRTDNVMGRIKFLVISISTIKFSKANGVPFGTVWAIIFFELFAHPKICIASHILNAVGIEINIWALGVKINGIKAIVFINKIYINKIISTFSVPLL